MKYSPEYLYDNKRVNAAKRLQGLEAVEDENTISLLNGLVDFNGKTCLEVGAGAGSIAVWLARKVGKSGTVTATDIEPGVISHPGFEIIRHDIEADELPADSYDFIHMRHVLIHLNDPVKALKTLFSSTRIGGSVLIEESDLSTWEPDASSPSAICDVFRDGVKAVLSSYKSRGMDARIGALLCTSVGSVGFTDCQTHEHVRSVVGGSAEAVYQSETATQLADVLGANDSRILSIRRLADCLLDPGLSYQSRTTVSVSAARQA